MLLQYSVYTLFPANDLKLSIYFVNSGHIEMSGQPVDSFTQQDIDSGVISYVHGTTNDKQLNKTSLRLTLQVSNIIIINLNIGWINFSHTFGSREIYEH